MIEYFLFCSALEKHGRAHPNEAEKYDRVGWYLQVEVRKTVNEYREHCSGTGRAKIRSVSTDFVVRVNLQPSSAWCETLPQLMQSRFEHYRIAANKPLRALYSYTTASGDGNQHYLNASEYVCGPQLVAPLLSRLRRLWVWAYIGVAVFGGVFVWFVGHRGIFFYDQSGVFDGAWRLIQGQVPYRDFYTPYGPVVFLIQSLFFRLAGVDFSSMVLSAAVVNSAAVLCVIQLIRRLLPGDVGKGTALGAGLLTCVWFQAPFGTLWFEQTSFLFNLFAMVLLVEAPFRNPRGAVSLRFAAGCLLAIAILSKQSAGFILLPVPLGVVLASLLPERRKVITALLQVSAGMFLVACVFVIWLWTCSSPSGFWQSVVVMTGELGRQRASSVRSVSRLFEFRPTWRFVLAPLITFGVFAATRGAFSSRSRILTSWIVLSYAFLQNAFAALTLQEVWNSGGYLGLINGLSFGLLSGVSLQKRHPGSRVWYRINAAIPFAIVFLFFVPGYQGYHASVSRVVQQFEPGSTFTEHLNVRGMSRLRWGDPTIVGPSKITRVDFEKLNSWLDGVDSNFAVFADATILYGLHRRISPHPWLYFIRDHSFLMSDIAQVDVILSNSLIKNDVKVLVLEKVSSGEDVKVLELMPRLQEWIHGHFHKTEEFGIYEIWMRQTAN